MHLFTDSLVSLPLSKAKKRWWFGDCGGGRFVRIQAEPRA